MSETMYQAFLLYNKQKNTFPLTVLVGIKEGPAWDQQQSEIHAQVKHYAEKSSTQYEWYQTSNGNWCGSSGEKDPTKFFLLMGQREYPEETENLLTFIIGFVEQQPSYQNASSGDIQRKCEGSIRNSLQAEEENYWQTHGQTQKKSVPPQSNKIIQDLTEEQQNEINIKMKPMEDQLTKLQIITFLALIGVGCIIVI